MTKYKCRWCEIEYTHKQPNGHCRFCEKDGTVVAKEAEQPTAAGVTANAQRLGEAESEASADEARALTGGPAKLMGHLESARYEALHLRECGLIHFERHGIRNGIKLRRISAVLAKLEKIVADMAHEGPAVSDKPSNAGPPGVS